MVFWQIIVVSLGALSSFEVCLPEALAIESRAWAARPYDAYVKPLTSTDLDMYRLGLQHQLNEEHQLKGFGRKGTDPRSFWNPPIISDEACIWSSLALLMSLYLTRNMIWSISALQDRRQVAYRRPFRRVSMLLCQWQAPWLSILKSQFSMGRARDI